MSRQYAPGLSDLMRAHASAATRYAAAVAKRMGIGASELAALEHLEAAGPLTPGQLGGRLSMTAGAVTALLDRLEGRGHVERSPNPDDRRSAIVRETEKGRHDSLAHLWPYIEEMRRIEESFTDEEKAVISRFLTAAIEATHHHAEALASLRPETSD
ncbi:MAG TPA: MarR family transcriptional regulator [Pseudonocardiaceae bacterium]|nr:MarR family transcriptional regulator [Pseudonocardiaceae bacterium]